MCCDVSLASSFISSVQFSEFTSKSMTTSRESILSYQHWMMWNKINYIFPDWSLRNTVELCRKQFFDTKVMLSVSKLYAAVNSSTTFRFLRYFYWIHLATCDAVVVSTNTGITGITPKVWDTQELPTYPDCPRRTVKGKHMCANLLPVSRWFPILKKVQIPESP